MKNVCNIVRDLLPLYYEDVCCDESKEFIEFHLNSCSECTSYAEALKENPYTSSNENIQEINRVMSLKKLKSKLFRKNIAISLTSVLVAISILLLIQLYQIPITYSDNLFTIEEAEDGVVDITFENSDYYCAHGMEREIIKDGIAINIQYIYFTDTIWTKFFTRGKPDEPSQFSIGQSNSVDYEGEGETIELEGQVDYIYYLIGDYKKINLTDEEYVALAEDAVLLWSRDKDGKKD